MGDSTIPGPVRTTARGGNIDLKGITNAARIAAQERPNCAVRAESSSDKRHIGYILFHVWQINVIDDPRAQALMRSLGIT